MIPDPVGAITVFVYLIAALVIVGAVFYLINHVPMRGIDQIEKWWRKKKGK